MSIKYSSRGQAIPNTTIKINDKDFLDKGNTRIYWLGFAGILIVSNQSKILIDPVLEGFDMPVLIEFPIKTKDIVDLDAILITHGDGDHCDIQTLSELKLVTQSIHTTHYVSSLLFEKLAHPNIVSHSIDDTFKLKGIDITLTPVLHNWQNDYPKYAYRYWNEDEACGFFINTTHGSIWLPGDSKLIDSQLHMKEPDVILFDFSNNPWHITFEGAIKLANAYPNSKLICIHWGSVDAPDNDAFNANPMDLFTFVQNPERIIVINPGENFVL